MKRWRQLAELFRVFFKIGLFTFGGGYAMISLIGHEVDERRGWIDGDELSEVFAIAESTPGPIAVNCATYVGYRRAGIAGGIWATLGVVLPAMIVMLLIAAVLKGFRQNAWVRASMSGVRPVVAGMILAVGLWTALRCLLPGLGDGGAPLSLDVRQIAIAAALGGATLLWRKVLKRDFSPILLILLSAACGVAVYGL